MDKNLQNKTEIINNAIEDYFKKNRDEQKVTADELCLTILNTVIGLKKGKQVRDVLRDLDLRGRLHLIPSLQVERLGINRKWVFVNLKLDSSHKREINQQQNLLCQNFNEKKTKDEEYILDLCDKVLNTKSSRQHRFSFLCGDTGRKLPVDAYYADLNLVIEYKERQHTESVPHFDKPDKMTVSGVNRGKQREIYDQRRRDLLPKHGITLVEISYSDFSYNSQKRISRNEESNIIIIQKKLINFYNGTSITKKRL